MEDVFDDILHTYELTEKHQYLFIAAHNLRKFFEKANKEEKLMIMKGLNINNENIDELISFLDLTPENIHDYIWILLLFGYKPRDIVDNYGIL